MKANLPAIQIYVGDWRKHVGIQALDYEARGVWFEMKLLMHESEDYGKLVLGGKAMPRTILAKVLKQNVAELEQSLSKILEYNVCEQEPDTEILFCPKMVREAYLRQVKVDAGRKGGLKRKQQSELLLESEEEAKQPPSVSVSVSSSKKELHLFEFWRKRREEIVGTNAGPRMQPNKKRMSKIRARMKEGYSVDSLKEAVEGCLMTPHNLNGNFTDIELICRDQQHVEMYRDTFRNGKKSRPPSHLASDFSV